jgi:RHS repeat-associated protein
MSGLAQTSCRLTRVRDANFRPASGRPGNRTKYSYDANGNAYSRQGSSITWSSYNYPTTVNAGSGSTAETVSFSYGPDRGRWQQSYVGNSTQETTDYVGGSLEVVSSGGVTDYRHYINAGGEQIAVYSRKSNGTNTVSYLLSDHQASVASITNSSGGVVVGESFTAFGSRRNPTTWSGAASNSDLTTITGITREGYTFQTALGLWMGMNHMNGRVEDSVTGRMLSADPHIPNKANPQSYNRYSYVNNNPVTYGDPSGFSPCGHNCKPVSGACATAWLICDEPVSRIGTPAAAYQAWVSTLSDPNAIFLPGLSDVVNNLVSGAGLSLPAFDSAASGPRPGETFLLATTNALGDVSAGGPDDNGSTNSPAGSKGLAKFLNQVADGIMADINSVANALHLNDPWPGANNSIWDSLPALGAIGSEFAFLRQGVPAAAEEAVTEGTTLYRVFGGQSSAVGQYWTTVNPATVSDFRLAAALPTTNSGQFVIQGTLMDTLGVTMRTAQPMPGGIGGWIPEVVVPNPATQICLGCITPANPPF